MVLLTTWLLWEENILVDQNMHHNSECNSHLWHRIWERELKLESAEDISSTRYSSSFRRMLSSPWNLLGIFLPVDLHLQCKQGADILPPCAAWLHFVVFLAALRENDLVNFFHVCVCKRHSTGCSTSLRSQNKYSVVMTFRMWKRMFYHLMISK